jgi:histidinol-phosphate aminotransferase
VSFDPSLLALPHVARMHAYTPGLQPGEGGWVKLNTNENPYPPTPRVAEALAAVAADDLRLYPEPRSRQLREAIARHHDVPVDCVLAGNGSDEVLQLLVRTFCDPEHALGCTVPSYSLYPVLAATVGAPVIQVEFDRTFELPVARCGAVDAPVFFLTSPNAPSGVGFSRAQIARLASGFRGLLVVDEAYAPFAVEDAVPLLRTHANLCVVRTFSKSHSLAGIRCGYLLGRPELVGLLDRVRDSYNLDRLTQAAAAAAIGDADYYQALVTKVRDTRDHYVGEFRALGWFTYDSQANFIFTEPRTRAGAAGPEVARALYDFLVARKVLVRHFPNHPLTASFLRITVGDDGQMLTLKETIDAWLRNA